MVMLGRGAVRPDSLTDFRPTIDQLLGGQLPEYTPGVGTTGLEEPLLNETDLVFALLPFLKPGVGLAKSLRPAISQILSNQRGLLYKTGPSTSPQLLKMVDTIKKIGAAAEEISPRMKAVTQNMPVNLLQPRQSRSGSVAEYLSPSPLREFGTANLYRPDPTAVLHEAAGHGLQALDPATRELIYDLYMESPHSVVPALAALGVPPKLFQEEFGARLIEKVLSKKVAEKLGMPLSSGPISFTPEAEARIWKFLQGMPPEGIKSPEVLSKILSKTKAPSTSSKLEQLYNDIVTFTAEENPIRSKIETNPFARAKFANQLKVKIGNFDDSPLKNKLMKDITNIGDLKDPKSALKLELLAQDVHLNTRMQAAKYEDLLKAEFGEEDATKIIDKLWNKIPEKEPVKLEKREFLKPVRVLEGKEQSWIDKGWRITGKSTTAGGQKVSILSSPENLNQTLTKEVATYKPMYYKVPTEGVRLDLLDKYPNGTSTLQMIKDGERTATTRSQPLGKVGDIVKFDESGDVYRITDVKKLEKNFDWNKWADVEGWDPEYIKRNLSNQVKPGAYQTFFEKVNKKSLSLSDLLKSERGSFSNKEIRKEMEESIGRNISKKVRGKTQPRKGGGMIVNKEEKLSDYLNEYPIKGKGWQLIRE